MSSKEIRDKIIEQMDKLPENTLKEILVFVSLKLSESFTGFEEIQGEKKKFYTKKDPLLNYIGCIEHGSLARNIDKELYGELS